MLTFISGEVHCRCWSKRWWRGVLQVQDMAWKLRPKYLDAVLFISTYYNYIKIKRHISHETHLKKNVLFCFYLKYLDITCISNVNCRSHVFITMLYVTMVKLIVGLNELSIWFFYVGFLLKDNWADFASHLLFLSFYFCVSVCQNAPVVWGVHWHNVTITDRIDISLISSLYFILATWNPVVC